MKIITLCIAFFCCTSSTFGQGDKIQELFQKKEWKTASDLIQDLIAKGDNRPVLYHQLGTSLLYQERHDEAEQNFSKAINLGFPSIFVYYNKSKYYASKSDAEKAAEMISKAIDNGMQDLSRLNSDKGFDLIRNEPAFKKVIERMERSMYPCRYDSKYSSFDFWIGEWNVIDYTTGAPLGKSKIEKVLEGCVIQESWQDRSTTGKSLNYYDPLEKKWKQNWVDAAGHVVRYVGEIKDNTMYYEGETIDKDGNVTKVKVTVKKLPDGSVRHTAENFVNNAWQKVFDGNYQRQ